MRYARFAIPVLALAVTVEGALQLLPLENAAAVATPYRVFSQRVRQYVPSGSHILGLHTYWFGFEDLDYRSFLVPLFLADEGLPLDQALEQVAPDTVLMDHRMRTYFGPSGDATPADRELFQTWFRTHRAVLVGRVEDSTYGVMEIYHLQR